MKKTIATCLLLILIFSCLFAFTACIDDNKDTDPIVGKYVDATRSDNTAYFIVRSDGTSTRYIISSKGTQLLNTYDDSWSYDETSNTYTFGEGVNERHYVLNNNNIYSASHQDWELYRRITDAEWPEILK